MAVHLAVLSHRNHGPHRPSFNQLKANMSILAFYNRILALASLTSDVEGNVIQNLGKAKRPFTAGGKRLVLPTPEVQRNTNKENLMIFHPLQESPLRGESDVMQQYRRAINITLNMRLVELVGELLELASSPKEHGRLKPAHLPLMAVLKDADQKTFDAWESLRQTMPPGNTERCITHIFIKKNAEVGNRNFKRGAIVSFPLYEELCKEGTKVVFDITLRKKDHAMLKALMEALFPDIQEKGSYSRGSSSIIAATLDSLLKAVQGLAGQINTVTEQFEDVIDDMDLLRYDDAWVDEANNLDSFEAELRMIPPQVGNEGVVDGKGIAQPGAVATMVQPSITQPLLPIQQVMITQPASGSVINERGMVDMRALMNSSPQLAAAAGPMGGMSGGFFAMTPNPTGTSALRQRGPTWANPVSQYATGHRSF